MVVLFSLECFLRHAELGLGFGEVEAFWRFFFKLYLERGNKRKEVVRGVVVVSSKPGTARETLLTLKCLALHLI